MEETLEAHGFGAQTLSGNCPHVGVVSAHKGLEMNSVINSTTKDG